MLIPGITNFFIILIMFFQILYGLVYYIAFDGLNLSYAANLSLSQIFSFIIPTLIYCLVTRQNLLKVIDIKPVSKKNIAYVIGLALLVQPAAMCLSAITSIFFPSPVAEVLTEIESQGSFLSVVIATCLIPAICEETAMRGAAAQNLKHMGNWGIVLGGFYFGIIHLNFHQFPYAFALGMMLFFMLKVTGSIFAPMIAHFTINLSQSALHSAVSKIPAQSDAVAAQTANTAIISIISAISAFIFVAVPTLFFILLMKKFATHNNYSAKQENEYSLSARPDYSFVLMLSIYIFIMMIY